MLAVDVLALAHERPNRLRKEAAAEGFRARRPIRLALARVLRHAADLLDRPALAPRPV